MKIINQDKWNGTYCEISQSNPIRWQNLKPISDGVYEPVSHWWKCKDFMNEVVTARSLGNTYAIYGFKCDPKEFFAPEQTTLPLYIKHITAQWEENMQVVNEYVLSQGFPAVPYVKYEEGYVVDIPSEYLHNTLFISIITLFIRMANINAVHKTMEGLAFDSSNSQDTTNYQQAMHKQLGKFPADWGQYVWKSPGGQAVEHGKKEQSFYTSIMHDCGVCRWDWKEAA